MTDSFHTLQDRQEIWSQVKGAIRREYGESTYRSWLRPIEFSEANDERIRLSVPSRFVRDWVQANYLERLRALWVMHEPEIETVEIIVRPATQPGAWPRAPRSPSTRCSSTAVWVWARPT